MNANTTLQLPESITHNDIIKTLRSKKNYAISKINVFSVKGQALFPFDQQEGRKIFLYSKIRVSKKDHMFLKYRNMQQRSEIRSSMFMFNQRFPFFTSFLFLFRPAKKKEKKKRKIAPRYSVVSSYSFQCITRVAW